MSIYFLSRFHWNLLYTTYFGTLILHCFLIDSMTCLCTGDTNEEDPGTDHPVFLFNRGAHSLELI